MQNGLKQIGTNHFAEDKGLCFNDFSQGMIIEHQPGRTITASDNSWASLLAMNQHPLHIDDTYASGTTFGRILVSSLVTFVIVNGMTVHSVSMKGIANLGWDEVRLTHPVFIGDTLRAASTVQQARLSKTRQGEGIVTVRTEGFNQDDAMVISFLRSILFPTVNNDL
ncbi:MAG: MaoC family dehydratase [Litoreibacter sp.]